MAEMPTEPSDSWIAVLDHWQTLATGFLAILAALIGGGFVYYQTHVAQAADRDRIARRNKAVRSTLPLVLSGLLDYARQVANGLRQLYLSSPDDVVRRNAVLAWQPPQLPIDEVRSLSGAIESASNEVADVIADLLKELQVQNGRLRGLREEAVAGGLGQRNVLKDDLDTYIADIADIYARCEGLLAYARRESETASAKPTGEDLLRALFLMGFHEAIFDQVKATVRRRGDRNTVEPEDG